MPRLDTNPPLRLLRLVVLRWLLCATVVFGAYNPSGFSYFHWVAGAAEIAPAHVAVGILVASLTLAILRMAFLSTGYAGTAALTLMVLMSIVLGVGLGLFEFEDVTFTAYTIEIVISLVLGAAVSWAFIQKRISGERDILRSPP